MNNKPISDLRRRMLADMTACGAPSAKCPAGSFPGGFPTPAPGPVATPAMAGIRNPLQQRLSRIDQRSSANASKWTLAGMAP